MSLEISQVINPKKHSGSPALEVDEGKTKLPTVLDLSMGQN